jgi:pullulanase/glycogen debranching enzyme
VRLAAGAPHPLGATWDGRGTNFALFSANAEKVELCLFDRQGRREVERIALPERTLALVAAQRVSIRTLRPSVQPNNASCCWNARMRG